MAGDSWTKNDEYGGEFTDAEAQQARAYLREHGGPVQQMMFEKGSVTEDGKQLFLINDTAVEASGKFAAGDEFVYVTAVDELIVSYYRRLMAEPEWATLVVGGDGGSILPMDGTHRRRALEEDQGG